MTQTSTRRAICATVIFAAIAGFSSLPLASGGDDGHTHDAGAENADGQTTQLHKGAALINARALYLDRCGSCHGRRGQGTEMAAVDFSDPEALVRLSPETLAAILGEGHAGHLTAPMSDSDRDEILGYLRNYLMLPAPEADTDIGRAIYARSCSVCHGDRGDAASWAKNSLNPAPADFTAHGLEQLTRSKMIDTVTFGERGTAMMPFAVQLSHEEIAATVDYIRVAFMPEGMGPGAAGHDHGGGDDHGAGEPTSHDAMGSGDTPFPAGLSGDPVWGKAFYNANCAECHGEKGDGEGRRAYFMIKKPENFLSREARAELNRPELFEHISEGVNGTTMPAWSTVLTPQQIANVGEYVYRAFLHPDRFAAIGTPEPPKWEPAAAESVGSKKN